MTYSLSHWAKMREACYLCLCYDVIYSMHFDLISILIDINSIILCYFLYVSVRLKKKKKKVREAISRRILLYRHKNDFQSASGKNWISACQLKFPPHSLTLHTTTYVAKRLLLLQALLPHSSAAFSIRSCKQALRLIWGCNYLCKIIN